MIDVAEQERRSNCRSLPPDSVELTGLSVTVLNDWLALNLPVP